MATATEKVVDSIYITTGGVVNKPAIKALLKMYPAARNKLLDEINLAINQINYEIDRAQYKLQFSNTAATRLRAVSESLDAVFKEYQTIDDIIPWTEISKESQDFAKLLDVLRKNAIKVSNMTIKLGGFSTGMPLKGLAAVRSYTDLKNFKDETMYRLGQMVNLNNYSNALINNLQAQIRELQAWINVVDIINTYSGSSFTYTGSMYLSGDYGIKWTAGTLTYNGVHRTISEGEIIFTERNTYYIYYDSSGNNTGFLSTTGEYFSQSGGNVRVAVAVITGVDPTKSESTPNTLQLKSGVGSE